MMRTVCVLNLSGNVGKSALSAHLLAPRLKAVLMRIESVNDDGAGPNASQRLRGRQFDQLQQWLWTQHERAVVDVGSSNVEDFLARMTQFDGSHEVFDTFVVPVVRERKQQLDTLGTIETLAALGVQSDRIRIVFNKVAPEDAIELEFPAIWQASRAGRFRCNPAAAVHHNDIFDWLTRSGRSLLDVLDDPTDYRQKLRTTEDDDERTRLVRCLAMSQLARSCNRNLDAVFAALFDDE